MTKDCSLYLPKNEPIINISNKTKNITDDNQIITKNETIINQTEEII